MILPSPLFQSLTTLKTRHIDHVILPAAGSDASCGFRRLASSSAPPLPLSQRYAFFFSRLPVCARLLALAVKNETVTCVHPQPILPPCFVSVVPRAHGKVCPYLLDWRVFAFPSCVQCALTYLCQQKRRKRRQRAATKTPPAIVCVSSERTVRQPPQLLNPSHVSSPSHFVSARRRRRPLRVARRLPKGAARPDAAPRPRAGGGGPADGGAVVEKRPHAYVGPFLLVDHHVAKHVP